jgi:phage baseplate assembly protein W
MKPLLDPAVPLGPAAATRQDDVPTRVRMVLGTRPGQLPWRPTFGCDLDRFVGQPVTTSRLEEMAERQREMLEKRIQEDQKKQQAERERARAQPGQKPAARPAGPGER